MKRRLIFLSLVSLILVTSCEIIEVDPQANFTPDEQDREGNLLIINNSNEQIALYKDQELIKMIPASATDYLVNIPNASEGMVQLDMYIWEDVSEDPLNPDPTAVFKRWMVPLSNSTAVEQRATWHLSGADQYTDVATLNLSYFGGTDYYAEVYLNGRTGGKIMALKAGDQYKKVGVDYGNYTLHYRYFFSDQNDASASEEIGWIENQQVNGEEKDIWLILNENRKDITMVVPHYGSASSKGTKYASIEITNHSGDPVQVYVGDKLIEAVCYLEDGNTRNLSTLDHNGVYTFILPITEEDAIEKEFTFTAKHLTRGSEIEVANITLGVDKTVYWEVDGEADDAPVEETPVEEETTEE